MSLRRSFLGVLLAPSLALALHAQTIDVLDPSRSGIPGEEMRLVRLAPDDTIWAAARWPFWGEGGIGMYDRHARTWDVLATVETPLTQFVNDVEYAADGAAWIALDTGLARFDGATWKVWNPSNSPMAFPTVRDLSIAPNGHVWINNSSFSAGGDALYDFDGVSTWVKHAVPQIPFAAPWSDLSEVFVDSQGVVWAANDVLPGVARYDGTSWTLLGAGVTVFDDLAEDAFGNLWLMSNPVTAPFGFHRFDGAQFTTYPMSSPNVLRSGPDGSIYVGSWNGVVQRTFDGGETIETYLTGLNHVFDVQSDPAHGEVWVATIGALGRFAHESGALLQDFNTWNTGFPDYFVDFFGRDAEDNFWVATGEAGISRFDGLRWRNFGNHNLGAEPYPWAGNEPMGGIFQDSTGTHWMGGNGIGRWHSDTGQFDGFWNWQNNPGMGVTLFPHFAEDGAGRIFAADAYGLVMRFDPAQSLWIPALNVYAPFGPGGMHADAQGDVWVAAWFDLHHWDGATWTTVAQPEPNYFFDLGGINAFVIAPDGTFWLGTNEGLVRWDGASDWDLFQPGATPLTGPIVTGLDARADGLLGIAARNENPGQPSGIALLDGDPASPASWRTWYYGASPIPHWQLGRVAFDPRGDLWVSAISQGVAIVRCGTWQEGALGALAGAFREPQLVGKGLALGGETWGVSATGFAPSAIGLHVVGFAPLQLPILGGVLVPSPDVTIPFTSDAQGDASASTTWPVGLPPGLALYLQSWVIDPAGAQGFAATNAARVKGI